MQLRAPKIMTMNGPSVSDHCIGIAEDRIQYILPISEAPHDANIIDLPHTTLLPGFVNAHCHMDLSHLRGKVPFTGSFTDWIRSVIAMREHLTEDDVSDAARELRHSGVTTVYDHVGTFSELSYIMDMPFRKRLFLEVIGVAPEAAEENWVHQQERAIQCLREGIEATPSPHATYSLHTGIFRELLDSSCRTGSGIQTDLHSGSQRKAGMTHSFSIHCAESDEEWEMFTRGTGKLAEFVRERATPPLSIRGGRGELASEPHCRNPSQPPLILRGGAYNSPLQYLSKNDLIPTSPWLAVHCNTLTDDDIILLKQSQATVVHCPRSHAFFNHPPFPLEKLHAAGIPIAIGTDSLASCPNFNFLEELCAMREEFPFLKTEEILGMATTRHPGLRAGVQSEDQFGCRIKSGMTNLPADIIGLPLQNDLLQGPVTFSMIGGQRVI
jgi:cytosine/adenosine deaminase-related metal-dependent hydrolase